MFNQPDLSRKVEKTQIPDIVYRHLDRFMEKRRFHPPPAMVICPSHRVPAPAAASNRIEPWPLAVEAAADALTVFLPEDRIEQYSAGVLTGALDRVLTRHVIDLQPDKYAFNFRENILSTYPLSGSALPMLRELVMLIENAVKELDATLMILKMGTGQAQMHFHFATMQRSAACAATYRQAISHNWVRAVFLCRRFSRFAAIKPLRTAGVWPDAEIFWRNCYDYLQPEDHLLFTHMGTAAAAMDRQRFDQRVVKAFEVIRNRLL